MPRRNKLDASDRRAMAGLQPAFARMVELLWHRVDLLCALDEDCYAVLRDGLRDPNRQLLEWSKGRLLIDGKWEIVEPTKIVTRARPGQSPHEYGEAVHVILLWAHGPKRGEWMPDDDTRWLHYVGRPAESLIDKRTGKAALVWGGRFKTIVDSAHIEAADWRERIPKNP